MAGHGESIVEKRNMEVVENSGVIRRISSYGEESP